MHNVLQSVMFYFFAGLTLVSALMVVTQKNPVHSVLFLVFVFFTSSVLWILLEAEFLALILMLVYVGAVMTLFLFVVMMLNIDKETALASSALYVPIGLMVVALFLLVLIKALPVGGLSYHADALSAIPGSTLVHHARSNTEAIGLVLYTDYLAAFELAAVILLVAIIASITLVHRPPHASKRQNVTQQIMTRREDRVTLVRMASE